MKYVMYVRMALVIVTLIRELFNKDATEESRSTAISASLEKTIAICPDTEEALGVVTKDDIAAIGELSSALADWEPED